MPRVWHIRDPNVPKDAIYIGRPGRGRDSKYGNKFEIGKDGTREEVIRKHKESLTPEMIAEIKRDLKGFDLICFCEPLPCHGHTLLEIANAE